MNPSSDRLISFLKSNDSNVATLVSTWWQSIDTYTSQAFLDVIRAANGNTSIRCLRVLLPITDSTRGKEAEQTAVDRVATAIGSFQCGKVTSLEIAGRNDVPISTAAVDKMLDGMSRNRATAKPLKELTLACCPSVAALDRFVRRFPKLATGTLGRSAQACLLSLPMARALATLIRKGRSLQMISLYVRGSVEAVSVLLRAAISHCTDLLVGIFPDSFYHDANVDQLLREVRYQLSLPTSAVSLLHLVPAGRRPELDVAPFFRSSIPLLSPTLHLKRCRLPATAVIPLGSLNAVTALVLQDCRFAVDGDDAMGTVDAPEAPEPWMGGLLLRFPRLMTLRLLGYRHKGKCVRARVLGLCCNRDLDALAHSISALPKLSFVEIDFQGCETLPYPALTTLLGQCRGALLLNFRSLGGDENRRLLCQGLQSLNPRLRELRMRFHQCDWSGKALGSFLRTPRQSATLQVLEIDTMELDDLSGMRVGLKKLISVNRSLTELSLGNVSRRARVDVLRPAFRALAHNRSLVHLEVQMAPIGSSSSTSNELPVELVRDLLQSLRTNCVFQELRGVSWSQSTPESKEVHELLSQNRAGRQIVTRWPC